MISADELKDERNQLILQAMGMIDGAMRTGDPTILSAARTATATLHELIRTRDGRQAQALRKALTVLTS